MQGIFDLGLAGAHGVLPSLKHCWSVDEAINEAWQEDASARPRSDRIIGCVGRYCMVGNLRDATMDGCLTATLMRSDWRRTKLSGGCN